MDPSYESSDDETDAMAQALGFSSFGTQGPTKKRKFNSKTDAMVEGQELAALDRGGKTGQGSGGNKIPLGKPRVFGVTPKINQDEIDLDVEEEEDEEKLANTDANSPPSVKQDGSDEEDPAYIDTSLPPPNEDASAAQQQIDAILAKSAIPPMPPESKIVMKPPLSDVGRGVGGFMNALNSESRPPVPFAAAPSTGGRSHMDSRRPREQGQKNELWYVDYYDASFNENPWAKLEKAHGLEAKGTWIEREGKKREGF